MHRRGAAIPPGDAGREEQVVEAIAIEIAHAVLSEGVDVENVTWVDRDVVLRVKVDGVVLVFVWEDVLRDAGEFARLSPDMDRIAFAVLERIREVQEVKPGVAAQVGHLIIFPAKSSRTVKTVVQVGLAHFICIGMDVNL